MKTRSKQADLGKWAEAEAEKWLELMSATHATFAYHRYPDAKAARGVISAQPADYLVARWPLHGEPGSYHLEVKETANPNRLPRSKIRQYPLLNKFAWAGIQAVVLVYRSGTADWTYFRNQDLFEHPEPPTSFPWVTGRSFPTAATALQDIFE